MLARSLFNFNASNIYKYCSSPFADSTNKKEGKKQNKSVSEKKQKLSFYSHILNIFAPARKKSLNIYFLQTKWND